MTSLVSGPLLVNKNGDFVDKQGRKVTLKGINLDAGSKLPMSPFLPTDYPASDPNSIFWDGDNVSFVGRPFPLEEAKEHILRIKSWGYNVIRYVITWEALEHERPGKYDDSFIEYTTKVLDVIHKIGGIYVFIDPHQDVWSRFTGGSGAPLWTLYAAGLDPKKFCKTQASILHNFYPRDPDAYPKMLWPSNYFKLAAGTMFTLFFAGELFAPKAVINGVSIQKFLQSHFIAAFKYFVKSLVDNNPEFFEEMIFGFEMLNEPNLGYFGQVNYTAISESQKLRVGPTPTFYQSLLLGSGYATTVDVYKVSIFGPKKTDEIEVDPEGEIVWLQTDEYDKKYGFERDEGWKLGECLWAQHGVWDATTREILNPEFFSIHPHTGVKLDYNFFIDQTFVSYYLNLRREIRDVVPNIYILLHPVVMQRPPKLIGTNLIDKKTVYAPHYYDGMSLMFKTWNRYYNVDTWGIVRNKYLNPIFGIVFGESNIRKSIRNQFKEIKKEGKEYLGKDIAVIMTETGMPFDMDGKKAYKDGQYDPQTSALDALGLALEGADISHTWWSYCSINSHKWGDRWNAEDFSFFSKDDRSKGQVPSPNIAKNGTHDNRDDNNNNDNGRDNDNDGGSTGSKKKLVNYDNSNHQVATRELSGSSSFDNLRDERASADGVRAANAVIRPYALKVSGAVEHCEFDLKKRRFKLEIRDGKACLDTHPTELYLPARHFQTANSEELLDVKISSGNYVVDGEASVLRWYHGDGEQTIEVANFAGGGADSSSFVDRVCLLGGIFGTC